MRRSGFFIKFLVMFILSSIVLISCGTEYTTTAVAVPNDMNDKASVYLPKMKHIKRNDKKGILCLMTLEPDDYEEYDRGDYEVTGEKGERVFLYQGENACENSLEGLTYKPEENRLILTDFKGENCILYGEDMGNDLVLEIHGDSKLNDITLFSSGLTIEGDGKLSVFSTSTAPALEIRSVFTHARLVIYPGVELTFAKKNITRYLQPNGDGGVIPIVISVETQEMKGIYYIAPLKMSDGSKIENNYMNGGLSGNQSAHVSRVDGVLDENSEFFAVEFH